MTSQWEEGGRRKVRATAGRAWAAPPRGPRDDARIAPGEQVLA